MPSFPIWPSRWPFITASLFTVYPPHHLQSCLPSSPHRHLIFEAHVMFDHLARHADVIGDLLDIVTQCSSRKNSSATKAVNRRMLRVQGIDIPIVFFNLVSDPNFPGGGLVPLARWFGSTIVSSVPSDCLGCRERLEANRDTSRPDGEQLAISIGSPQTSSASLTSGPISIASVMERGIWNVLLLRFVFSGLHQMPFSCQIYGPVLTK